MHPANTTTGRGAATLPGRRRADIELLRIASSFGIVWYHAGAPATDIAYAGLVAFIVLSLYFWAASAETAAPVSTRLRRLMLPWLVWTVFFGLFSGLRGKPVFAPDAGGLTAILAGTSIHLWYLPYLFAALFACDAALRVLGRERLALAAAAAATVLVATAGLWRPVLVVIGAPYAQYVHASVGVAFGVFLGLSAALAPAVRRAVTIVFLAACAVQTVLQVQGIGVPYLLGCGIVLIVLSGRLPVPPSKAIFEIAALTYGIYLVHPLYIMVMDKLRLAPAWLVPFIVFALSAATIWGLRRALPKAAAWAT